MQWSKLKTRIKSRICPELRDRVHFYLTSYRRSHDGADKVWITVDGQHVLSCKYYLYYWAESWAHHSDYEGDVKALLASHEVHDPAGFGNSMREYLDMPIAEALASGDPLVKAFAIIDRRVGKRTLAKMEVTPLEHKLVKTFYQLRAAREDIN